MRHSTGGAAGAVVSSELYARAYIRPTSITMLPRHVVARLRRLGAAKILGGGNSYWSAYSSNYRNRHFDSVQNNAAREMSRIFLVCTPLVTCWGYISRKVSQKKVYQISLLGQEGSLGAVAPVPLPSYVLEVGTENSQAV